ncbi:hypothetical protein BDW42DRAFT_4464 [Aspergillus taichungensis]|uniref:Uncharacterized protein n=1 Tax=Aspergillus taichungensis TaxID=482145 RepID=A0A2J5HK39_9EURO|nr:hypothetical protein BDW42DRAFT_4464 [Aspergillus taichungensis]
MKLSLALILSSAATAMALPKVGGDQAGAGTAGGSAPGAPSDQRSAGQPSSSGGQGNFTPGYSTLIDAVSFLSSFSSFTI